MNVLHDPLDALTDVPLAATAHSAPSEDPTDELLVHSSAAGMPISSPSMQPTSPTILDSTSSATRQGKAAMHVLGSTNSPLQPHESELDPLRGSIKAAQPMQPPATAADAAGAADIMSSMASVSLDDAVGPTACQPGAGHARVPSAFEESAARSENGGSDRDDAAAAVHGGSTGSGRPGAAGDDVTRALLSPAATMLDEMTGAGSQQADAVLKVWIKDPEKVELTRMGVTYASFYIFLIKSEAPGMAGFGRGPVEVKRRFSDFDALHRMLKAHYRGYFVPPLPDKAFFDSKFARDSFLKVRRVDLQAFIRSVASHPVLRASDEVCTFLTASGDLHSCTAWQQMLSRPSTASDGLRSLFAGASGTSTPPHEPSPRSASATEQGGGPAAVPGLMMRVKHSFMSMGARKVRQEVPEDELQLRQAKEWLRELQQHLHLSCQTARSLVQHMEGVCEDWSELGKSYAHMARYEEGAGQRSGQYTAAGRAAAQRASDLQHMGYTLLRQHTLWKQFSMRTAASLVFLHDYYVLMPNTIVALEDREAALASVQLLQEELKEKHVALARAQDSGDSKRSVLLANTVHQLQDRIKAAQAHYETLKERNLAELARLNLERAADFRRCLSHFADVQVQLSNAAADVWASVAKQLKAAA